MSQRLLNQPLAKNARSLSAPTAGGLGVTFSDYLAAVPPKSNHRNFFFLFPSFPLPPPNNHLTSLYPQAQDGAQGG